MSSPTANTAVKLLTVMLQPGADFAAVRSTHIAKIEKLCETDEKSKLIRKFLDDTLGYYSYSGKFTPAVVKEIEQDMPTKDGDKSSKAVLAIDSGKAVKLYEEIEERPTDRSWWLPIITNTPRDKGTWPCPGSGGEDIDIYIVDSGFGKDKEELLNITELEGRCKRLPIIDSYTEKPMDDNDENVTLHGHYVARLAGGTQSGVAPKCNIFYVSFALDGVIQSHAMHYALETVWKHIKSELNEHKSVINCSWGVPTVDETDLDNADTLRELCAKISEIVPMVCAAGNDKAHIEKIKPIPAILDHTICVGASTKYDQVASSFSNYGERVDIYAPGRGIEVKDSHGVLCPAQNGTSFATPQVSGAVACLMSGARKAGRMTQLTTVEMKDILRKRAKDIERNEIESETDTGQFIEKVKRLVVLPY
ncbi:subtilisin-like serine protease [Parahypoxylon ruwenzoriense]